MNRCLSLLLLVSSVALAADGTSARLAAARDQVQRNPSQPDAYTRLAVALTRAARATGYAQYLDEAQQAIAAALRLAPRDFEARKTEVSVLLAEWRYPEALEKANALHRQVPDDNLLYGYIADAEIALGDYPAAEKAVQHMLDQRQVNAPGLQRGALLRECFGYNEPALEWWNSALRITSATDVEERAWILVNMSRVDLRLASPAGAARHARQALDLVPGYPWASDALAAALMEQAQPAEAADILRQRVSAAPDLAAQYHLAAALEAAGNTPDAASVGRQFEKEAAARVSRPDNANRELIEYYASHERIADALKLANDEVRRRHDIATLAAYAFALARAGKYDDARVQMQRALAPGIRDPKLASRAASIAARLEKRSN